MQPEVFGFGWRFAILQIFGGGDDITDLAANLLGNQRRVSQFTKTNGDIDIFSDQIQKHVGDEKVDLDARIEFQEIRNESEKWVLPQNHGHGDLECTLRLPLRPCQNPFRVEQEVQRFTALMEIIPALRSERELARRS